MIYMSMRKDHYINRQWIKTKMPVKRIGFLAHSLEHTAIKQYLLSIL